LTILDALRWNSPSQIAWSRNDGATLGYRLYRGTLEDLQYLSNDSEDSCLWYEGGDLIADAAEDPAAGSLFWFVVTGVNLGGEGTAGYGAGGPRMLDSRGDCKE
jgi:hypothetical protein